MQFTCATLFDAVDRLKWMNKTNLEAFVHTNVDNNASFPLIQTQHLNSLFIGIFHVVMVFHLNILYRQKSMYALQVMFEVKKNQQKM